MYSARVPSSVLCWVLYIGHDLSPLVILSSKKFTRLYKFCSIYIQLPWTSYSSGLFIFRRETKGFSFVSASGFLVGLYAQTYPIFYVSERGQKGLLIQVLPCLCRSPGFRAEPESRKKRKCWLLPLRRSGLGHPFLETLQQ